MFISCFVWKITETKTKMSTLTDWDNWDNQIFVAEKEKKIQLDVL